MKEPKLKTVYVCSNCGEDKPPLDGPAAQAAAAGTR